ncbi:MAG: hypothetical protein HQ591_01160 [candidate division Zixibacteria bacterium]|nr:hypothetical protein [Candidatus Tariuqbacter arcticus]
MKIRLPVIYLTQQNQITAPIFVIPACPESIPEALSDGWRTGMTILEDC